MPELPEVETVVRTIAPRLTGRRILQASFTSRFVTPGNRRKLAARFAGRTILGVRRQAKFILVDLDQGLFTVHLGMTGKLLADVPATPHTRAVFTLDDGVIIYDDPRQFGRIEWGGKRLAALGPEPLEVGFEEFSARLTARRTQAKALLLDQRFLGGLGNIYADEALFRAGIHPRAVAARLSPARAARLYEAIREVLALAIEHRGSSISDYVDGLGRSGEFQLQHRVYGREGEPCVQCGMSIRRIVLGGRSTHYCWKCQR